MIIRLLCADEELVCKEHEFATIELLDIRRFRSVLRQLNGEHASVSEIIIENDEKRAVMPDDMCVIYNPLAFDINAKEFLSKLYKKLESDFTKNDDGIQIMDELNSRLIKYIDSLINLYPFDLDWKSIYTFKDYLKFASVKLDETAMPIDRMAQFIRANAIVKAHNVIIYVNAKSFYTQEEMEILTAEISATHTNAVFLESVHSSYRLSNERKLLFDEDMCCVLD